MILAYIENDKSEVTKGGRVVIKAALQAVEKGFDDKVVGLLIGEDAIVDAAANAAKYGLNRVVYIKHGCAHVVEHDQLIRAVCEELQPSTVMALANTTGKDVMPRIAQYLGAGQASDVLEFVSASSVKRPMYAGDLIAEVEFATQKRVITVRGTAFDPAEARAEACEVSELSVSLPGSYGMEFLSYDTIESARPELTEAEVVVSGGRAMKSAENFEQYIAPLADSLNAAIGASRAAVDSGYAPNDWQVGQTGKVVAPDLYIAIGISGAIQHLAGMKDSKVIVAINKDPDAPIFEIADYGLVADLYDVVPQLTEAISQAK